MKVVKGPRLGMGKPCAEMVAGIWCPWLGGAVAVPLALSYPEAELLHVLFDAIYIIKSLLALESRITSLCIRQVLILMIFFKHSNLGMLSVKKSTQTSPHPGSSSFQN